MKKLGLLLAWLMTFPLAILAQSTSWETATELKPGEQVTYENVKNTLYALEQEIIKNGYEGLAGLLEDNIMDLDAELAPETVEQFEEGTQMYQALLDEYKAAYTDAKTMAAIVTNCESIAATTDFGGLAAFQNAITLAKNVLEADVYNLTSKDDFTNALAELLNARGAYLMSQEPFADGSYDFSRTIANPFFCNDEYTPTWDGNRFVYSDQIESEWFGADKAWELNAEIAQGERTILANNVIITSDTEAENCWVVVPKTTSGF